MNMKAFPGFFSLILLFWAYNTGHYFVALISSLFLELHNFTSFRFNLPKKYFNKILDTSIIMMLAFAIIYNELSTHNITTSITTTLFLLPFIFSPVMLSQLYNKEKGITLSALFNNKKIHYFAEEYHIDYMYSFFWIFSAGVNNNPISNKFIFSFFALIILVVLIKNFKKGFLKSLFILALSLPIGFYFQKQIVYIYQKTTNYLVNLYIQKNNPSAFDPFRTNTEIGKLGKLKMDSTIVMRVYGNKNEPLLIKKAIYDKFLVASWEASDKSTQSFFPNLNNNNSKIKIIEQNTTDEPLIGFPDGTLPSLNHDMVITKLGTIQSLERGGTLVYDIQKKADNINNESEPTTTDLKTFKPIDKDLDEILHKIKNTNPETVKKYFEENYQYSLDNKMNKTLYDFLKISKSGHCEYFATITVLLYRKAGIPARYTIGYSAQEWSELEDSFIARKSDAHAWARVWLNNKWVDVDTTPPDWISEKETSPIGDFYDHIKFKINNIEMGPEVKFLLISLVSIWLVFRIYTQFRSGVNKQEKKKQYQPGEHLIKNIYKITKGTTIERKQYETISEWLNRIGLHKYIKDINESVYGDKIHSEQIKDLENNIRRLLDENKS